MVKKSEVPSPVKVLIMYNTLTQFEKFGGKLIETLKLHHLSPLNQKMLPVHPIKSNLTTKRIYQLLQNLISVFYFLFGEPNCRKGVGWMTESKITLSTKNHHTCSKSQ